MIELNITLKCIWSTVLAEVFQVYVWFPQSHTLDLTSAGHHDLIRAAQRDVRGHKVACLVVVNVECDVTLIRAQAEKGGGRKTSLRVPSLPQLLTSCQSQCCLNVPGPISGGEKSLKGSGGKKRGWSPQLKLKHHLGKQTGFPPVVTHRRHTCHLFLPVTSHPSAPDHPHTAQEPAVVSYTRVVHRVNGLIWLHCMESRIIHECYIQHLTLWNITYTVSHK